MRHSINPDRIHVEIDILAKGAKLLELVVTNEDPCFELNDVIVDSLRDIAAGYYHGLWRVKRLTSSIYVTPAGDRRHRVTCSIYGGDRPTSVFDELESKATIIVEWEYPRVFWIEASPYTGAGIICDLDVALRGKTPSLLDLYFGQLTENFEYLCIQSQGNVELSEQPPFAHETLPAALEAYFQEYFARNRVLVLNIGRYCGAEFERWRKVHGVPVFNSVADYTRLRVVRRPQ